MTLTQVLLLLAGAGLLTAGGLFTIAATVTGVRRQVEADDAFTEPPR